LLLRTLKNQATASNPPKQRGSVGGEGVKTTSCWASVCALHSAARDDRSWWFRGERTLRISPRASPQLCSDGSLTLRMQKASRL
jgi:hypothetical protein